jgi:hypothetical protein
VQTRGPNAQHTHHANPGLIRVRHVRRDGPPLDSSFTPRSKRLPLFRTIPVLLHRASVISLPSNYEDSLGLKPAARNAGTNKAQMGTPSLFPPCGCMAGDHLADTFQRGAISPLKKCGTRFRSMSPPARCRCHTGKQPFFKRGNAPEAKPEGHSCDPSPPRMENVFGVGT